MMSRSGSSDPGPRGAGVLGGSPTCETELRTFEEWRSNSLAILREIGTEDPTVRHLVLRLQALNLLQLPQWLSDVYKLYKARPDARLLEAIPKPEEVDLWFGFGGEV